MRNWRSCCVAVEEMRCARIVSVRVTVCLEDELGDLFLVKTRVIRGLYVKSHMKDPDTVEPRDYSE